MPSAWCVSILTGEVSGGRCDYCNKTLSADAMFQTFYQAHRGHIQAVFAWARIARPVEYRGLELKLPVELFVGRNRPCLENQLHLPGIVFKFSCKLCQIQRFPASEREVLAFRSHHSSHIQAVRLHAVVQNFGGRAVKETFAVSGQKDSRSWSVTEMNAPSALALDRAAQLRDLCKSLHCTITGIRCTVCQSRCLLKDQADVKDELSRHEHHLNYAYLHVTLKEPQAHAGLELEVPAHPFALSSLMSRDGLKINCVLVNMSRQHGGPSITPWNAAEVENYIQAHQFRRNQAKFCALVRAHGGRVFQCEFPVIHIHSRSSPRVAEWEKLFSHPEMEQA